MVDIQNIGKKYRIGQERKKYHTLRESIVSSFKRKSKEDDYWALRNVNLQIKEGEAVGIIGKNGAGKSTLLKILSRITHPSEGKIILNGRIASLLEVGTGFHQELTGRENIFLNGSILGLRSGEIKARFDDIVEFSGVQKFIDTPIKFYSSGMQLRLAFAVASYLDPEILVIDEVLAVGDSEFQKKCIGRMNEVSKSGRTLLFVSHDMNSVLSLCSSAVLLDKGSVVMKGSANDVVQKYSASVSDATEYSATPDLNGKPKIVSVKIESCDDESLRLNIGISSGTKIKASVDFHFRDQMNRMIGFGSLGALTYSDLVDLNNGITELTLDIDISSLASGDYNLAVDLTQPNVEWFDRVFDCLSFKVDKKVKENESRVLQQSWGYGSVNFQVNLKSIR
ncbi:MAG TPA: ABC transporter ATP-binding protein [Bacteroidia bacterium]|nr:ABC transporter ATP-binding protein [Bacteroidia bacterium]HQF27344.1 ABC transporter ATP-binding protein [Bacteroidia bacterium]